MSWDGIKVEPTLSEYLRLERKLSLPSMHLLARPSPALVLWATLKGRSRDCLSVAPQAQKAHDNVKLNKCLILFRAAASLYASVTQAFGGAQEPLGLLWA